MIYVLERTSQPDIEPVTLEEMLAHLREFSSISTARQDLVDSLITGSREWVEDYTGRSLIDQGWRLSEYTDVRLAGDMVAAPVSYCGQYARQQNAVRLRRSPILAITSVVSVDSLGVETEIDADTYEVRDANSKWPMLVPKEGAIWTNASLRIAFRSGFVDRLGSPQQTAILVPERFKQAMKLWTEANYDRGPDMKALLDTAQALIRMERSEFGGMA